MLKILFSVLFIVLILIGLSDVMHSLWSMVIKPTKKPRTIYLVYLDGENDFAILSWLSDKIRWSGSSLCDKAVAVKSPASSTEILEQFSGTDIDFIECTEFKNDGELYEQLGTQGNS